MPQFWPPAPPRRLHGTVAVSSASMATVTFAVPFASVPMVFPTARDLSANGAPHVKSVTASGFQVALSAQSGTVTGWVDWVAEVL